MSKLVTIIFVLLLLSLHSILISEQIDLQPGSGSLGPEFFPDNAFLSYGSEENQLVTKQNKEVKVKSVSTGRAMLFSALVPGLGEMQLGNYTRGAVFLGAEILILASYFRINREVSWKTNSYQKYANRYADIAVNSSDDYYRLINNYISSDQYNAEIELFLRNRYIIFEYKPELYYKYRDLYLIGDDEAWEWDSRDNWLRYREIRREKQSLEILANFALGAALLNRVISIIDSALLARSINRERTALSNLSFEPDIQRRGCFISYEFNF